MTDLTDVDPLVCQACGKSFYPRHAGHEGNCALCKRLKKHGVTPLVWCEGEDVLSYVARCEKKGMADV